MLCLCAVQVDHEPSVPTLEALLLSCLAFGAVHNLSALVASCLTLKRSQTMLLQSAAAVVAVVLELLVSQARDARWTLPTSVRLQLRVRGRGHRQA